MAAMTPAEMAEIFVTYDVAEEDLPDCQPEAIDKFLCPSEEKLPCGPIAGIEKYCKDLLGAEVVAKYPGGDGVDKAKDGVKVSELCR